MRSGTGAPQIFLASRIAERRDGRASAPQLQIAPVDVSTARPHCPTYSGGCNTALIVLGFLMLGVGTMTTMIFSFLAFKPKPFTASEIDSRFLPCLTVPVVAIVLGITFMVVGCKSAKRMAMRQNMNSRVAPPQASWEYAPPEASWEYARPQASWVYPPPQASWEYPPPQASWEYAQSFTTPANVGTAPCTSRGHISGSDSVRGNRPPEATSTSTRTAFTFRPAIYTPTINLRQCSDHAPPSYEVVMQKSISSSLV